MSKNKKRMMYTNSYIKEHYDRIMLLLPKGTKLELKSRADKEGISVNRLILNLITETA